MICNGFVVQDLNAPWIGIPHGKEIAYRGLCAYIDSPLLQYASDPYCRMLNSTQSWIKADDGSAIMAHFISTENFLKEYLFECFRKNIKNRVLRVESECYHQEICSSFKNAGNLIGYEVCSLPIDYQVIEDLMYNPACLQWKLQLNQSGLFPSLERANSFLQSYETLATQGLVGDGEADIYVFAVFEVDPMFYMNE